MFVQSFSFRRWSKLPFYPVKQTEAFGDAFDLMAGLGVFGVLILSKATFKRIAELRLRDMLCH